MIEALIAGETNPTKLAGLADRRVKASPEKLREALRGRVTKAPSFNQIDGVDAATATIDGQVEANLEPFRTAVELIMSIPGIARHRLGDRHRHQPVPFGRTSHLMGLHIKPVETVWASPQVGTLLHQTPLWAGQREGDILRSYVVCPGRAGDPAQPAQGAAHGRKKSTRAIVIPVTGPLKIALDAARGRTARRQGESTEHQR
jgi:hypothetical protein